MIDISGKGRLFWPFSHDQGPKEGAMLQVMARLGFAQDLLHLAPAGQLIHKLVQVSHLPCGGVFDLFDPVPADDPLDQVGVSLFSKNTIRLGVKTAKKGISIAVDKIIAPMRGEKLLKMAEFVETITEGNNP